MFFTGHNFYFSSADIPLLDYKFEEINRIIHSGALTALGKEFSFEVNISIHHANRSNKTKLFETTRQRIKRFESNENGEDNKVLQVFRHSLEINSSLITHTISLNGIKEHTLVRDLITHFESQYTAVVTVPESCSRKIYQEYMAIAIPFKEKLLCEHIELLKKIYPTIPSINAISDINVITPNIKKAFKVDKKEVTDYCQYLGEGVCNGNAFTSIGMRPLNNIYECYGFALALLEVYRPFWQKYNKKDENHLNQTIPIFSVMPCSIEVSIVTNFKKDDLPKYKDW